LVCLLFIAGLRVAQMTVLAIGGRMSGLVPDRSGRYGKMWKTEPLHGLLAFMAGTAAVFSD